MHNECLPHDPCSISVCFDDRRVFDDSVKTNIHCTAKMNLEHIVLHAIMSHAYYTVQVLHWDPPSLNCEGHITIIHQIIKYTVWVIVN